MARKSILENFRAVISPVRQYSTKRKVPDKTRFTATSGTYPEGFIVSGTHVGVKKDPTAFDLALIFSEKPCSAAAVFTQNAFKAAPVQVSQRILKNTSGSGITGVVANSGCANAVTGQRGMEDAWSMSAALDRSVLGTGSQSNEGKALVMSTGVIGQNLPIDKIVNGVPKGVAAGGKSHEDWMNAAKAICTTDTFPKLMSKEFTVNGKSYRVAGLAKGAGMIHPNMATLLGLFATDAPVAPTALGSILTYAVERSFNSISVDGDMSTNDTIAALANGAAGGDLIDVGTDGYEILKSEITSFSESLAQLVVRDGEGATKFVTINVEDAESFEDAKKVASTIATSSLVKTALYGEDANWGRITCAIGYSDVPVNPLKTSVSFVPADGSEELKLLVNGEPENVDEERASQILTSEDLIIHVQLGTGGGHSARFWTCDLSHDYVTINGDYRS
ncbi:arginine biosynthesis protein ArgJ [Lipomyces orientalis]|uniref:Arginine biosynthesis protein ArgJ n=1 Tax=Lipomyces orientalis TaxID=1233043 RepID=A0ACC3U022_9ASCO